MRLLLPLAFLICLVAATWYVTARPEAVSSHPFRGQEAGLLLDFDLDNVGIIRIDRGAEVAILRRNDGTWTMTSPVRDRVHQALPELLMDFAAGLEELDSLSIEELATEGHRLEDYGLGERAVHLRYADADNEAIFHLDIGRLCPWHVDEEPTLYVHLPRSPASHRIFVVPATARGKLEAAGVSREIVEPDLPHLLAQPFETLRSNLLLPFTAVAASRIEWTGRNTALELEKRREGWHLVSPISTPAEEHAVAGILGALTTKPARQLFAADAIPFSTDHYQIRLEAPDLDGEEAEFVLDVALPPTDSDTPILVRPEHRKAVFGFDPVDHWLFDPAISQIRSRQLLHLGGWAIREIAIHSPARPSLPALSLVMAGDVPLVNWLGEDSEEDIPDVEVRRADREHLDALLKLLISEQVRSFVTDTPVSLAPYGLDAPWLVIDLGLIESEETDPDANRSATSDEGTINNAGAELDRRLQVLLGEGPDGHWYARRSDEPTIFQIDPLLAAEIPAEIGYWRSRRVLDLPVSRLLEILRRRRDREPEILRFNPVNDEPSLLIRGEPQNTLLQRAQAESLRDAVARLEARAWLGPATPDQEAALADAPLVFELTSGILDLGGGFILPTEFDPASANISQRGYHILRIAPWTLRDEVLWIGRLEGDHNPFLLDSALIDTLSTDLVPSLDIPLDEVDLPPPPPPPPGPGSRPGATPAPREADRPTGLPRPDRPLRFEQAR